MASRTAPQTASTTAGAPSRAVPARRPVNAPHHVRLSGTYTARGRRPLSLPSAATSMGADNRGGEDARTDTAAVVVRMRARTLLAAWWRRRRSAPWSVWSPPPRRRQPATGPAPREPSGWPSTPHPRSAPSPSSPAAWTAPAPWGTSGLGHRCRRWHGDRRGLQLLRRLRRVHLRQLPANTRWHRRAEPHPLRRCRRTGGDLDQPGHHQVPGPRPRQVHGRNEDPALERHRRQRPAVDRVSSIGGYYKFQDNNGQSAPSQMGRGSGAAFGIRQSC